MLKTFPSSFPVYATPEKAFASLVSGDTLTFDPGVYDHVDILPVTGQDITIDGTGARLHALTPKKASLVVQDSQNVKLTNLHLTGSPVVRSASDTSCGILVYRSSGVKILRNHVNSFAGAGIHLQRTTDFLVQGNLVQDTLADSIHMTNRTNNGRVLYNTVRGCGDDGVACVGYVKQLGILHDILIKGNHIYGNTHGRGVTIEGADRVTAEDNYIENTSSAGIIVISTGSYNTYGCREAVIQRNLVLNCNYNTTIVHGAVLFSGRAGEAAIEDGTTVSFTNDEVQFLDNEIVDTIGGPQHIRVNPSNKNILVRGNRIVDSGSSKQAFGFYGSAQVTQTSNTYNGTVI